MNKIIPTPRDKHPDPKLRGDRISGEDIIKFMQKNGIICGLKFGVGIASEIQNQMIFLFIKLD